MRIALALLLLSSVAHAQPARPDSLTIDAADVATFTAGPQHAKVRWVNIEGCGTVKDLTPLRGLPAEIEVKLGSSNCLTVEHLDGLEQAKVLQSFALHVDITALDKAANLQRLHLHNGPLPLATLGASTLAALDYLDVNLLKNTPAEATQFLASPLVAQVRTLAIGIDRAPKLPPLPTLTGLYVSLMLADPKRIDLSFVRQAPNATHLKVGGALTADLSPILALRKLETVDVAGLCRVDARPLAKLPRLRSLGVQEQLPANQRPVRKGLDVHDSNPYALCNP